jgi:hypothetical protein
MSLGLKAYHVAGAEFAPRIEYNAKSGRLVVVNRREGVDGAFSTDKIDVTMTGPEFALDIGSIQIGWIHFPAGAAPDAVLVPYGEPMPPRPSSRHKAGFQVKIWNGREPDTREFKSTAGVVVDVIETLWDEIATAPEAARGMVPVVKFVNAVPVTGRRGTNYSPDFRLVGKWIDRDERVFGPRTVAPPNGKAAPVAPSQTLPPPQWQASPAVPQPVAQWQAPPLAPPVPVAAPAW